MMNKMPTRKASQLRLLIVLPLAATLLFAFRGATLPAVTIAGTEAEARQQNEDTPQLKELVKQLKQNPQIKNARGLKVNNRSALVLNLKGGGTEVYYLDDAKSIAELEHKYVLSTLPPPPPVGRNLPAQPAVQKKNEPKKSLPESVVYYLDGVETSKEAVGKLNLNPKEIHSINVLKGEEAGELLTQAAAKGVISIVTKENQSSPKVLEFNKRLPAQTTTKPGTSPPPQEENPDEAHFFILDQVPYYKDKSNWPKDYKAFLEINPSIEKVAWKFNNRRENNLESIVFLLKSGKVESYDYNDNPRIPAAEAKYGELPQLPPPPPPTRSKEE